MRPLLPIILFASTALASCGSSDAGGDSASVAPYVAAGSASSASPASAGGERAPSCLTAAEVSSALGYAVRDLTGGMRQYGPMWSCGFVATDTAKLPGATVTITIEPASEADQRFAEMRQASQMARRVDPDVISVGERGMAYGMSSGSTAAAVKDGRLYSVQAGYATAPRGFGDRKDAVTALLRKLVGT